MIITIDTNQNFITVRKGENEQRITKQLVSMYFDLLKFENLFILLWNTFGVETKSQEGTGNIENNELPS